MEVSAAPFHLWKDTASEGATTAPAIVKLPNQKKAEETNHSFASVLDVFPTLLDYAHIPVPQGQYKGTINTPSGYSWKSVLENKSQTIRPANFSFADELHGSKYAKQGEWKIALQGRPELEQVLGSSITLPLIVEKITMLRSYTLQKFKSY